MVDLVKKPAPTECFVWTWSQTLARLASAGPAAFFKAKISESKVKVLWVTRRLSAERLAKCLILLVFLAVFDPQLSATPLSAALNRHPDRGRNIHYGFTYILCNNICDYPVLLHHGPRDRIMIEWEFHLFLECSK